ncbi:autophagy-related protein 8 [Aspergillus affinis]|nr:uncharacterized protein KD926_006760 [Aspergillus affinis]KAI9041522.1 hypothetical protein KD926_006760 [Aspergillus affinis]
MRSKFKDEHPFEKRKAEAERIRQKYADRIPVICEKVEKSDIATIDKKKYLVPADLTVGQFVYVIRKRIKLSPEKAIFIFVDEVLPPTAALMSSIYEEHKDEDGFLYITYSGENTFGEYFIFAAAPDERVRDMVDQSAMRQTAEPGFAARLIPLLCWRLSGVLNRFMNVLSRRFAVLLI